MFPVKSTSEGQDSILTILLADPERVDDKLSFIAAVILVYAIQTRALGLPATRWAPDLTQHSRTATHRSNIGKYATVFGIGCNKRISP